ncbi:MAG: tRNA (cytidine/uridine-2'-O-)-methyltransferase [Candidatus Azotimanducaceae bacterium]
MIHVGLFEPEIPPNTGNIIRLCANTGASLHLVEPLGFELDDKRLRRAGLDYHEWAAVKRYPDLNSLLSTISGRVFGVTTKGSQPYTNVQFEAEDLLLFGPETRGLPEHVLSTLPPEQRIRIPMQAGSRSLNLSNAAAVLVYEVWRQMEFRGAG